MCDMGDTREIDVLIAKLRDVFPFPKEKDWDNGYDCNKKDGWHLAGIMKDPKDCLEIMIGVCEGIKADKLLGRVIFRIDGNRCFSGPIKGIMGYYKTREGAKKHLQKRGFYLETRKWKHIGGHEEGTKDNKWYNKKLSEDGYNYDNTSYAFITEVELRD